MSIHPARDLDKDLEATGIQKCTQEGELDFHACSVAYINVVLENGVHLKEAQILAQHATPGTKEKSAIPFQGIADFQRVDPFAKNSNRRRGAL